MHDRSPVVRALEFYSGIGGLCLALKRSKVPGIVVKAFDWDPNTAKVYEANHGHSLATKKDISELTAPFLASYRADFWILSPACQPYTVLNPGAKGNLDPRAKSFLHLVQDVLPELVSIGAHPTHFLIENVAGFEESTTRQILLSQLHSLSYTTAEFLLTPLQFDIPNSRLRYYLLAKAVPFTFPTCLQSETIYRCIPQFDEQNFKTSSMWVDPRIDPEAVPVNDKATEIRDYLDNEDGSYSISHPHAVPDRVLEKWGRLFDIVLPSSKRTCCFTRGYTQLVERAGSILQMNTNLDTEETFDTFLAAKAAGQKDAVSILHPLRLRYFTPSELLRIFHFNPPLNRRKMDSPPSIGTQSVGAINTKEPKTTPTIVNSTYEPYDHSGGGPVDFEFFWPDGISTKTKYRLIGNSVNVRVVTELIDFLYEDWGACVNSG